MSTYLSHQKLLALRQEGRLKDRPILSGDFVTTTYWPDHKVRVGAFRRDDGPRFLAQVPHVDKEPVSRELLMGVIEQQQEQITGFLQPAWEQWRQMKEGQPHRFEYDLGNVVGGQGKTYRLTLVVQFLAALNPNFVKYSVETEDRHYRYQRDWYGDWPDVWRWRPKNNPAPLICEVNEKTLLVVDADEHYIPWITMSEYRRVEAALKAGRSFEWGGPARISPDKAQHLHRPAQMDDVFVDESGVIYWLTDAATTTAVDALTPADRIPVPDDVLLALRGSEEKLAEKLVELRKTWEQEQQGEPDNPLKAFNTKIQVGEHNDYTVYLHFAFSPMGGDTQWFACVDDQANYQRHWDWEENQSAFADQIPTNALSWRYQRLKTGQDEICVSPFGVHLGFSEYNFHSGRWEGQFNPAIYLDDIEPVYKLSGANGDFWVTEDDLHRLYRVVPTRREYNEKKTK